MAVLSTVVEPLVGPMIKAGRDLAFCSAIGSQFVRNDAFGHEATTFHQLDQKPLCRALVSSGPQDFLKNYAMLINRAPEPIGPACDLHNDFVHMPDIAGVWLPSPQVGSDEGAELDRPTPDRFIRNVYATFKHHLPHLAQTQVEPDVKPDSMSNDLGWKPVVLVVDFMCLHRHCLPPDQLALNLRHVKVTTPFSTYRDLVGQNLTRPPHKPVQSKRYVALRLMRTRIRLLAQPEPMRSIVGATQ